MSRKRANGGPIAQISLPTTIEKDAAPADVGVPGYLRYIIQDANYNVVGLTNNCNSTDSVPFGLIRQFRYMPYGDFEHDPDGTITGIEDGDGNDLPTTGDGSSLEIYHGFQGLWLDPATGMYNARGRIYDPPIGRYLQPDPNGQALVLSTALAMNGQTMSVFTSMSPTGQYTDGSSLYQFVRSNPLSRVDPTGQSAWDIALSRNFDDIYDSFYETSALAYLGAQGAATFGGFWGGNVALMPRGAQAAAGVSEGFSEFADLYAQQMMYLPADAALAGTAAWLQTRKAVGAGLKASRARRARTLVLSAGAARGRRILQFGRVRALAGIDPNVIRAAKAVKPKPGYFDVLTHGSVTNPMVVVFRTGSAKGSPLNHRTLAVFMKSQGWRRGMKVRLLSCSTGNTGFAQNLANKLGVEVLAPMGRLKVYLGTGRLEVIDGLRSWKAFLPGRR